jgi:ferric-dicitrate binding protein FerR (iron transport regulator)
LLGLSYYFWHAGEKIPVSTPVIAHQVIAPGTDKAILILDDNSSYELSAEQNLSLNTGGSRISSIGNALKYTQDEGAPKPKETRYNTLKIPRGGQFVLFLEDSTKVWLNSETSLRFPVSFTDETREVELIGEAYFEVQKDTRPFRVISGQQVVEVLGTEFNISSYPESPHIVTTLVEGKVDVHLSEHPAIRQTLTPNHQSTLVKTESQILRREVDPHAFVAWKEGRFCFKEQSLENIMKTLSRWYNVEIVFETEQAKQIRFTGDIKRHEDFKNIVELIEKTQEVKFRIEGRSILIK